VAAQLAASQEGLSFMSEESAASIFRVKMIAGMMVLRNIDSYLPDYSISHRRM
jgi:hypothetical protein